MSSIGNKIGVNQRVLFRFVATSGQTNISGVDQNGITLNYTPAMVDVYLNGFLLTPKVDYTASNGSSVVIAKALGATDEVIIIAQAQIAFANTYTQGQVDGFLGSKFNSTGGTITGTMLGQHINPSATNLYDLGTASVRWRNIYTQDLHLSNGIGDYTVIEGEENLYLINNKTNKSFKFALIEVDPTEVPPKSESD